MFITKRDDYPSCSDLHPLIDAARDQGWRVQIRSNGHLAFLSKDRDVPPVFGPRTPSDIRSVRNVRTKLRHAGLDI